MHLRVGATLRPCSLTHLPTSRLTLAACTRGARIENTVPVMKASAKEEAAKGHTGAHI